MRFVIMFFSGGDYVRNFLFLEFFFLFFFILFNNYSFPTVNIPGVFLSLDFSFFCSRGKCAVPQANQFDFVGAAFFYCITLYAVKCMFVQIGCSFAFIYYANVS